MKKNIKLRFVGKEWDKLPAGTVPHPFDEILPKYYNLDFTGDPDYIISKESRDFYRSALVRFPNAPVRILFAGEAFVPDFNIFDYAIGFDHMEFGDRYCRLHTCNFFSFEFAYGSLEKKKSDIDSVMKDKDRFCNFIYSNSSTNRYREKIFHAMSEISRVDAAGKLLNNYGGEIRKTDDWRQSKIEFQRQYRFTIAAENSLYPGYTTEKLLNPMFSLSIPIYWGNSRVGEYFNSKSFINCHDYDSLEDVRDVVSDLENNPDKYFDLLSESWMTEAQEKEVETNRNIYDKFIRTIFDQEVGDARRRGNGTWVWNYEQSLRERISSHDTTNRSKIGKFLFSLFRK